MNAIFNLSDNTFKPISEGSHIFRVDDVDFNPDFGKAKIYLKTVDNKTQVERYTLTNSAGEVNQGACNAFSWLIRNVMNNQDLKEIEPEQMVGHYVKATVTHTQVESKKEAGKMLTFCKLSDYEPATGFDNSELDDDDEFFERPKSITNDNSLDDLV